MSDDERDFDMDSDEDDYGEDDFDTSRSSPTGSSSKPMTQAEKRAHHNALERKRRDHIKDSFTNLRDSVPSLHGGEKVSKRVSSRAQILKKAAEYILFMKRKNSAHQHDIEDLKKQNSALENQIRALEKAKATGNLRSVNIEKLKALCDTDEEDQVSSTSSSVTSPSSSSSGIPPSSKKLKVFSISK